MLSYGIMQGRLTVPKGRGIQFFPFENWENEFVVCKRLGLAEIEFIFDYDDYMNNPLWTDDGINRIKNAVNESGVRVKSVCFDYFMKRAFYKASAAEKNILREENTRFLMKMFKAMESIGGCLIEIPSVDASSLSNEIEKKEYYEFLTEVENLTKEEYPDIKIGLETDMPVDDFVRFIDHLGSERIGANYDSGNSSGLGYDLYEEVTKLGKRIFNIHIKDRVFKGTTVALGTGDADFDMFFRGLSEIDYSDSLIIQAARGDDYKEEETIAGQKEFIVDYVKKYNLGEKK